MNDDFEFTSNNNDLLKEKKKAGRPKKTTALKNKQVACYLTEEEYKQFQKKLDGRPSSVVVRSLVLEYIRSE